MAGWWVRTGQRFWPGRWTGAQSHWSLQTRRNLMRSQVTESAHPNTDHYFYSNDDFYRRSYTQSTAVTETCLCCLSVHRGHAELLEGHCWCGFAGWSGDQHQHRAPGAAERCAAAQGTGCLTGHRYRTTLMCSGCWEMHLQSRAYARLRARLRVHKHEKNGKKEQIQLLLEADGWKTNARELLEMATVGFSNNNDWILHDWLFNKSWICSSFLTDQVTLWLIAALIPDSCLVEVAVLSNLAQVFGLLDSVKKILERRRQQTDPCQEQILSTITSEYSHSQLSMFGLFLCKQTYRHHSLIVVDFLICSVF